MKIVFKIIFAATLAVIVLGGLGSFGSTTAHADGALYFSTRDLLADFFRTSQSVTYKKVTVADKLGLIQSRLGYTPARATYTFYVAQTKGQVDGFALIDEEKGQHLPITFAVKISPTGVVLRQEIVAYREARGDEVRDEGFRKQFVGKTADSNFSDKEIVAISGATISSTAMSVGVKRALVLFETLVRPSVLASAAHPAL